jgi:hypothetical protein
VTFAQLEQLAAEHGDQCPPLCPACLSRDLSAKAQAVRETCARLVDSEAEGAYLERDYTLTKALRKIALLMRKAK